MIRQEHDFSMELFDSEWQSLGRSRVAPDWAPLAEHVHFSGIRRGTFPPVTSQPPADLLPVWRAKRGEPFVGGVRIEMCSPSGERFGETFPIDCFKAEARRLSGEHIAAGTLKEGDVFRYMVMASRREQPPAASTPRRMVLLDVREIEQPLCLIDSCQQSFVDRSVSLGGRSGDADDAVSVFVAQELIAQCADLVRDAGKLETGGVLIGRLHRDPASGPFLEVTAQISAEHLEQHETQLTFTDRTWAAARDALTRRQSDELILGWWHSHPDFCAKCTDQKRSTCALNGIFFSATDVSLHRTMFPRAWQIGLLFSNRPAGIIPALFGWQRGVVVARPFFMLAPSGARPDPNLLQALGAAEAQSMATVGGNEHATH